MPAQTVGERRSSAPMMNNSRPAGRLTPRRAHLGVALLVALDGALILVASRLGPGLSPDSVAYASAARSLAHSGELAAYFSTTPLTIWPPGLPAILGMLISLGISTPTAAILLNLFAMAVCVALTFVLAVQTLHSRAWGLIVTALVAVSPATINLFTMLWSEPLFTVCVMLTLVILASFVHTASAGSRRILLLGLCMAISAGCLIRYTGAALIPLASIGVYLALRRDKGHRRALIHAGVVGLLSSAGIVFMTCRNLILDGHPLGDRLPSHTSLDSVVINTFRGLGEFVVFDNSCHNLQILGGILIVCVFAGGVGRTVRHGNTVLQTVLCFVILWWGLLIYSEVTTKVDRINSRLLYPALAAMAVVVASYVRRAVESTGSFQNVSRAQRISRHVVLGVTGLTLAVMLLATCHLAYVRAARGFQYSNPESLASPLTSAVSELPSNARVASNDNAKVYWNTGRRPVYPLALHGQRVTSAELAVAASSAVRSHRVDYIALFTRSPVRTGGCTSTHLRLRVVSSVSDGVLIRIDSCA